MVKVTRILIEVSVAEVDSDDAARNLADIAINRIHNEFAGMQVNTLDTHLSIAEETFDDEGEGPIEPLRMVQSSPAGEGMVQDSLQSGTVDFWWGGWLPRKDRHMISNIRVGKTARKILSFLSHGPASFNEIRLFIVPPGRSARWGNSYFLPPGSSANGASISLVAKGLVHETGKGRYGATLWGLTEAGKTLMGAQTLQVQGFCSCGTTESWWGGAFLP